MTFKLAKVQFEKLYNKLTGTVDIAIQDQTTKTIDERFSSKLSTAYSLAEDTTPNTYTITLTDATGLTAGDKISMFQDHTCPCFFSAYIKSISGNILTLNVPTDCVYSDDNDCELFKVENNMASASGATTPIVYSVDNNGSIPMDINRVNLKMVTETQPDMGDFGDGTILTNGLLLRHKFADGTYHNIYNARSNSEIALVTFDLLFFDAAKFGVYGIAARLTFNGLDKHGVVLRLEQGESLEMLVQDDLTGITDIKAMAQGSFTDEF